MEILLSGLSYKELPDTYVIFICDFIRKLQNSVNEVKVSREMGARYMTFQELLKDEREMGREEGEYNKLISQVQKKLDKGQSVEQIADDLVEDLAVIQAIVEELRRESL